MPTEDAYSSGQLVLYIWDLQLFFCLEHWHISIHYTTSRWRFPWVDILPNLTPFFDLTPPVHDPFPDLTSYWIWHYWLKVSIGHMQRVWHADRGRLLLQTPGPVPLWDLQVFLCWDQSLLNLSCFRTFEFRISLGTSFLLHNKMCCVNVKASTCNVKRD